MKDKAEQERRELNRKLIKKTWQNCKDSTFSVSLCKCGILGGIIVLEGASMRYISNKAMLPKEYKHIEMKYQDIFSVKEGSFWFLPTVTIQMKNEKEYQFLVYRKKRFLEVLGKKRR